MKRKKLLRPLQEGLLNLPRDQKEIFTIRRKLLRILNPGTPSPLPYFHFWSDNHFSIWVIAKQKHLHESIHLKERIIHLPEIKYVVEKNFVITKNKKPTSATYIRQTPLRNLRRTSTPIRLIERM